MEKLITVERARAEIDRLQRFVDLAENYKINTLERWIIREYAYTNSIKEVVERAKASQLTRDGYYMDREYIISVINGKPEDELHRIMKAGYRHKIRPNKRRALEYSKL